MKAFAAGDFLPEFTANSSVNPQFGFTTVAGRQLILAFVGSAHSEIGGNMVRTLVAAAEWFGERRVLVYLVTADPRDQQTGPLTSLPDRFTVFWDFDRTIHRSYRMLAPPPESGPQDVVLRIGAYVIRENLRLHALVPVTPVAAFGAAIRAAVGTLPIPDAPRLAARHAPVLMVPDVISREQCRQLIAYYERKGGSESGFMRDVGGQTRGLLDGKMKRRKDCNIEDPQLTKVIFNAMRERVAPEIRKAFGYRVTRIERYVIGCYEDGNHGFFSAHRDNTSKATAHRAFAVSLNLNSEDYEGGHLAFPEYGSALYKPETGAAVVFSCSLLHEARPVTRGRRYVILPFLYNEHGAAIRSENRKFLASDPPMPVETLAADASRDLSAA